MYFHRQNRSNPRRFSNNRGSRAKTKTIDSALFVRKANPNVIITQAESTARFSDLPLLPIIQQAVVRRNYLKPTPIQEKSIPHIVEGKDVVGIANTGTGKTGAFVLPLLQKMVTDRSERALILVPTRELALQIQEEIRQFSYGMNIYTALCIGGASMQNQIFQLSRTPNFIIATPGRLKDLIARNVVRLSAIRNVVLDEADRMVDMGFIHDITQILSLMPQQRQSLFFSATLPTAVNTIINRFLKNPVTVSVKVQQTAENIEQNIIKIQENTNKIDILQELLRSEGFTKVIIFGRTKWGVERLSKQLNQNGFKSASIHGDKPQRKREQALAMFKNHSVAILVATDVAARGIDIPDVSHVINFDQPATYEDYVHRIGRTGRGNKIGYALTFV